MGAFLDKAADTRANVKRFITSTGPRRIRKLLLKNNGLKKLMIGVTKSYKKFRGKYNVFIGRYKALDPGRFVVAGGSVGQTALRLEKVNKDYAKIATKVALLNKKTKQIEDQIKSMEKNAGKSNIQFLQEKLASTVVELEKYYSQGQQLASTASGLLDTLENGQLVQDAGIEAEKFLDGFSVGADRFVIL